MAKGGFRGGYGGGGGRNMNMLKQAQKMQQDMIKCSRSWRARSTRPAPAAERSPRRSAAERTGLSSY